MQRKYIPSYRGKISIDYSAQGSLYQSTPIHNIHAKKGEGLKKGELPKPSRGDRVRPLVNMTNLNEARAPRPVLITLSHPVCSREKRKQSLDG